MITRRYVPLLLIPLIFILFCRSSRDPKAISTWEEHEKVIQAVVNGELIPPPEFGKSCYFFERLTGIPARTNHSYVGGPFPTEHTPEDLASWQGWYRQNKDQLHWDDKTEMVILKPRLYEMAWWVKLFE